MFCSYKVGGLAVKGFWLVHERERECFLLIFG